MLGFLASLFGGPIINGILDGYKAKLAAADSADAHAVDLAKAEIAADIQARAAAKEIRLATAGFFEMRVITFLIAAPFALHALLVGLDTCFRFGWGIPAYPKPFVDWEGAILMSFFGLQAATGGVAAIAGALARRA